MRYLPHTDDDIKSMLETSGHENLDDLFKTIPRELRLEKGLELPESLTEWELNSHMEALSSNMNLGPSFIGAGSYSHYIPAIVPYLAGRGEFLTAYTPYQPEISQGTLQGIYEYQTMICRLLGMDMATASHYDGGTALAEALLIGLKKKKRSSTVAVSSLVHPHHRQIIQTYLGPTGFKMELLPFDEDGTTDYSSLKERDDIAAVAVQSPNFFGCIENLALAREACDTIKALFITSFTEAMAYGLLKKPGIYNPDIVAGEGQSLGISQSFGGAGLGVLSGNKRFIRDLPGRLVGKATDKNGEPGFVLTLSTREQHIRREKASSNICSNNGLNALTAGIYMATMGKIGMKTIAQLNHDKAVFLKTTLESAGFSLPLTSPFFNEFVVKAPNGFKAKREALKQKYGIIAGLDLEAFYPLLKGHYLFCATETISKTDIETLAKEVI